VNLVAEGLGAADRWWGTLGPWVAKVRVEDANPGRFEHFEWMAASLVRLHPALAFDQAEFERTVGDSVASLETALRDLEAMRR
jgi:hypothetical protein